MFVAKSVDGIKGIIYIYLLLNLMKEEKVKDTELSCFAGFNEWDDT